MESYKVCLNCVVYMSCLLFLVVIGGQLQISRLHKPLGSLGNSYTREMRNDRNAGRTREKMTFLYSS